MTSPYDKVRIARSMERPIGSDYIKAIMEDFIELHGDRLFMNDMSIIGGIATIKGTSVTVLAQEKGSSIEERIKHNFGSPHPEGYRKVIRLIKQAEKFNRPVICFVDTIGASCDEGAEERGQGFAIGQCIATMLSVTVPVISVIVGEGGSGGALALSCGDRVYMLENSVYSVLSPEAFASILWKDKGLTEKAARAMKLTSAEVMGLGLIDGVIAEPLSLNRDSSEFFSKLKDLIYHEIISLSKLNAQDMVALRYDRYRKIGCI